MPANPLRPLTYAALLTNGLLLLFFVWHLAFEAIPAAVRNLDDTPSIEGRALALIVLVPDVLVGMYVVRSPHTRILQWRTAAALLASMAAHIALLLGIAFYMVSLSMP
ncbi:hypothetical protein M8A51_19665 [Schlegelella sp. S2-27]|uniref:DUF4234 domain-containing protein n=1 Tax=Caldimonas mangrovi TaxID=2944811 RepID=A0ABT0YUI7_9BURK|nr:hypothetical protein [Caldimonas mangrovi]MCM5681751.1 hypothetical protein [Caldimonas mangrovi]